MSSGTSDGGVGEPCSPHSGASHEKIAGDESISTSDNSGLEGSIELWASGVEARWYYYSLALVRYYLPALLGKPQSASF